jgi:hypothetical protein
VYSVSVSLTVVVCEPHLDMRVLSVIKWSSYPSIRPPPPPPLSPGHRCAIRENYQQFRVWWFWPQGCPLTVCMPVLCLFMPVLNGMS